MSELTKNVQPLQDFDWDQFENGTTANVSKEDLDKAYDETLNKVSEHQVVDGTVISVDKKEVVINIGYKSDGIIPASEFRYNPDLKAGDVVEQVSSKMIWIYVYLSIYGFPGGSGGKKSACNAGT